MKQSIVWTGITVLVSSACIERTESEKDLSTLEEFQVNPLVNLVPAMVRMEVLVAQVNPEILVQVAVQMVGQVEAPGVSRPMNPVTKMD